MAGPIIYEKDRINFTSSLNRDGNWNTVSLSAFAPAGAKCVIIEIFSNSSASKVVGSIPGNLDAGRISFARDHGETLLFRSIDRRSNTIVGILGLNASNEIQYKSVTSVLWFIRGWLMEDWILDPSFPTIDLSLWSASGFIDIDIGPNGEDMFAPGDTGDIEAVVFQSDRDKKFKGRSSIHSFFSDNNRTCVYVIVPVDSSDFISASGIFEKISGVTGAISLVAYIKSGKGLIMTPDVGIVTVTADNVFNTVDFTLLTASNADGIIYESDSDSVARDMYIREPGSIDGSSFFEEDLTHKVGISALNSSQTAEALIETSGGSFNLKILGYTIPAGFNFDHDSVGEIVFSGEADSEFPIEIIKTSIGGIIFTGVTIHEVSPPFQLFIQSVGGIVFSGQATIVLPGVDFLPHLGDAKTEVIDNIHQGTVK